MKIGAITFRVIISYLLIAITSSSAAGENEAVVDFNGKQVKTNVPYYAGFVSTPAFITRYRLPGPESCPEGAVFSFSPNLVPRIPIIFVSPSSSEEDVVRVTTELSIKFASPSECGESGFWRVTNDNGQVLLTGSRSSNDSMFTIERFYGSYRFAFKSAEIGIYEESFHVWRLKLRKLKSAVELDVSFFPAMNQTYSAFTN